VQYWQFEKNQCSEAFNNNNGIELFTLNLVCKNKQNRLTETKLTNDG